MSKALVVVDEEKVSELDDAIGSVSLLELGELGKMTQGIRIAAAISKLRTLLTPEIMQSVMALQGSSLGFRTDKDSTGGYRMEVVKECMIEGLMRGVRMVANEMNIIAGRCYVTKEGFSRLLREYPGFTDLRLRPGVPVMKTSGSIVHYRASWKLNGVPDEIDREIPVKVNNGMGADAILGKAERKIKAAIYAQITGSDSFIDGEIDDVPQSTQSGATRSQLNDLEPDDWAAARDAARDTLGAQSAKDDPADDVPFTVPGDMTPFEKWKAALDDCGTQTQANECLKDGLEWADGEMVQRMKNAADIRKAEIRNSRGGGSQKSFAD